MMKIGERPRTGIMEILGRFEGFGVRVGNQLPALPGYFSDWPVAGTLIIFL